MWRSSQLGDPGNPVSDSPDLADEPALAWRTDLPPRTSGPLERWRATAQWRKWLAVVVAAVVSGPLAVLAALVENSSTGAVLIITVVVLAPLIEESVKGAGALVLAEARPWLVPSGAVLPAIALASGLVFAGIENLWYLEVLIDDPSARLVRWRWIFGPIVHGVGSLAVGFGALRVWRRAMAAGTKPSYAHARPWIIGAAVWHGAYNAVAVALDLVGTFNAG